MKKLIIIFLILFAVTNSYARGWYFATSGNDATGSGTIGAPYQTITKLNAIFSSFSAGDFVYFNGGDTFYGTITVTKSGSSGNPITITSYGIGQATITGFTNVVSWTSLGGNIWESTGAVSTLSSCNMVSVNGVNTAMGRYPNTGFLTFGANNNSNYIVTSLTGTPNWTGASVVLKKQRYTFEIGAITANSNDTLRYTCPNLASISGGNGFFIQNDIRTLDAANEWYYNPSTKKIDIYSTSSPTNVQVASAANLIFLPSAISYVTINNINFIGSSSDALNLDDNNNENNNHITVTNCNISFAGRNGIVFGASGCNVENNTISSINNTAIDGGGNSNVISNNIKNTGLMAGMTQTYSVGTLVIVGDNSLIQYNNIDSTGYSGIRFRGNNIKVYNNFINHSCLNRDDGGGIYTWGLPGVFYEGREIKGNIVLNSIGTSAGCTDQPDTLAHGIYLDAYTQSVLIDSNTVSGCSSSGYLISNNDSVSILNNTAYDNSRSVTFAKGEIQLQYICCFLERKIYMKNNFFIAKGASNYSMFCYTVNNDIAQFISTSDSNYFARPINDNTIIKTQTLTQTLLTLSQWRTNYSQDIHSLGSPKSVTSTDSLTFLYNATQSPVTTPLSYNYIDMKGNNYNGSITLAPYTSAVLIQNGSVTGVAPPVVNAGANQIIYLPATSTTMSGTVTPASGHTATYLWATISGGGTPVFSDITILNPNVSALTLGSHIFRLTATQDDSQTGYANVTVTVNNPTSQTWTHPLPITFVNH